MDLQGLQGQQWAGLLQPDLDELVDEFLGLVEVLDAARASVTVAQLPHDLETRGIRLPRSDKQIGCFFVAGLDAQRAGDNVLDLLAFEDGFGAAAFFQRSRIQVENPQQALDLPLAQPLQKDQLLDAGSAQRFRELLEGFADHGHLEVAHDELVSGKDDRDLPLALEKLAQSQIALVEGVLDVRVPGWVEGKRALAGEQ